MQMQHIKRGLAALLCAALTMAVCPVWAGAAAAGVVTTTAAIGGGSARLVYVTMDGSRTADVALAGGSVHQDTDAATLVSRVTADGNSTVVAAINGGFFNSYYNAGAAMSYPNNCPRIYSTVVRDGRVVNGMGEANLLGVTWDGKPYIDRAKTQCSVLINGKVQVNVWAVNDYYTDAKSISLLTGEFTLPITVARDSKVLTLRDGRVAAVAGGGTYTVPAGAQLLVYNAGVAADAQKFNLFPAVGDSAAVASTAVSCVRAGDLAAWQNMKTVVAGGRMLLQNGVDVTDSAVYNKDITAADQAVDSVAQRSFAAIMNDGRLVLGTASSASLRQVAAYLKGAGAVNAVSLDGGASSMLYVPGTGYLTTAGRRLASAFVIVDEAVREQKPEAPVIQPAGGSTTGLNANEPSAWAAAPIDEGKTLGLIPDWLQFNYRANITRREFCVLIVTMLEKKTGGSIDQLRAKHGLAYAAAFSDTDDFYVRECASFGIVNGIGDGRFGPGDSLTRQEAAAILQRAAKLLGASGTGAGKQFADAAKIDTWARDAVAFVTANGIMNGIGDTFDPHGHFTREQAFITMRNAYQNI